MSMNFALPAIAMSAAIWPQAVASFDHGGRSHLPVAYARSLGRAAVREVRKLLINGEGGSAAGTDVDADFESIFSAVDLGAFDFGSTMPEDFSAFDFGDTMADAMSSMAPMMCSIYQVGLGLMEAIGDAADLSVTCPEFGCDNAGDLVMDCRMEGEMCEEHASERYCATATSIYTKTAMNLTGITTTNSTQCNNFTSPQRMADMGRVCFTVSVEVDYGELMSGTIATLMDAISGQGSLLDALSGQAGELPDVDDLFQITSCSSTFGNGTETECDCGICEDGMSFTLVCPNNLISEECTDFEGTNNLVEFEAKNPVDSVAVLRLIEPPSAGGVTVVSDVGDIAEGTDATSSSAPETDTTLKDAADPVSGTSSHGTADSVAANAGNVEKGSADGSAGDAVDIGNADASDADETGPDAAENADEENESMEDSIETQIGGLSNGASPTTSCPGTAAGGLVLVLASYTALL